MTKWEKIIIYIFANKVMLDAKHLMKCDYDVYGQVHALLIPYGHTYGLIYFVH